MSADGFRASVNRRLALRVGSLALVLGAVFAGIAALAERQRLEAQVVAVAKSAAGRWNTAVQTELDGAMNASRLQNSLQDFAAGRGTRFQDDGRFVLVRVYDTDGRRLAGLEGDDSARQQRLRQALDDAEFSPPPGDFLVLSARLEGDPYVAVALALANSTGQTRAWLVGVFAPSEAQLAAARRDVLRTIAYVLGIVLLTALAAYPVIRGLLSQLSRLAERLLDANLETLQVLGSAIAKRDSDTDAHNYRVTVYSVRLAERTGLNSTQIQGLIKGALLHDVGKLGIRDNVLLKPGRLDEKEFEVMRTHVEHGLDITARAEWLNEAREVVGSHHEKYAGDGYPRGLSGEQIPVSARIFAIADVFDALTSKRPYKEPMSYQDTMAILEEGRGRHFDPALLDHFGHIARALYDEFGGRDGDEARRELGRMIERYFRAEAGALLDEA